MVLRELEDSSKAFKKKLGGLDHAFETRVQDCARRCGLCSSFDMSLGMQVRFLGWVRFWKGN